jgi:glycosyltransferase involved in cell wall biosynthesis
MRILMLSHLLPYPADNGAKLRILNLARQLMGHEVVLVCPASSSALSPGEQAIGHSRVVGVTWSPAHDGSAWRGYLARPPREIIAATPGLPARAIVDAWVRDWRPDLLIATDPILGEYVRAYPQCQRMVDIAAEYALYIQRTMRLAPPVARPLWALRRLKWVAYTRSLAGSVDLWSVPSPVDQAALQAQLAPGARVVVVPNGVDLETNPYAPVAATPPRFVYSGALSYAPNLDAVTYFCREIWPGVRAEVPEAELLVTGDRTAAPAFLHTVPGLTLTGHLPEVRSLVSSSCAAVVPLRLGVGTRLKIMEAMALGTPVISTSVGAEGLAVTHGTDIVIADTANQFTAEVVRLARSPALRASLSRGGRALVETHYAWGVIGQTLRSNVERLGPTLAPVESGSPLVGSTQTAAPTAALGRKTP